ncbi:MAG: phytanoyl-CoA dioxygenase family protein [Planctomycetes bacterium]|nr:phytanoyl-CoA dioxygenase family protein [Planctomycetota bacterium]
MPDAPAGALTFAPEYAAHDEPSFRAEFLADMARQSPLQARHARGVCVLRYDRRAFDVRALVGDALAAAGMLDRAALAARGDRLETLHDLVDPAHQAMDVSQQSAAARALYEMPAAFAALHERLLAEVVVPQLGLGPAHCQRTPTFRAFFPQAPGYPGETTYHNDLMLGHNPREVNVFVPLVRCEATRSLLLADLDDSLALLREFDHDFPRFGRATQTDADLMARCERICRPLEVDVGDIVVFDSRCLHAGPANRTALTRVTFDTRLLPVADLATQRNRYRGLGRRRASFTTGEYFSAHPIGGTPR